MAKNRKSAVKHALNFKNVDKRVVDSEQYFPLLGHLAIFLNFTYIGYFIHIFKRIIYWIYMKTKYLLPVPRYFENYA